MQWLGAALESLDEAIPYLSGAEPLHPQYASTAVAVYKRCVSKGWSGERWAAARLASVTQALDRAAPRKLQYPGEPAKDQTIDRARAEMSALYDRGAYAGEPLSGVQESGLFGRKRG